MDMMDKSIEILQLDEQIAANPADYKLRLERGKLYFKRHDFGNAQNDFMAVLEIDPAIKEAEEYIVMIKEILEFRNVDIYNP